MTVLICICCFILVCPPIVELFDRNDIWVGFMPLSQFFIIFFTGLVVVLLFIMYKFDAKYDSDEFDLEELIKEQEGKQI